MCFIGWVVDPKTNPQTGRPEYPFLFGLSPLTSLTWENLPVVYATATIALGVIWSRKPDHYFKVRLSSGGVGGNKIVEDKSGSRAHVGEKKNI